MRRLTRDQVRSIDRLCVKRYGLPGIVLMENAARAAADVAWDMLSLARRQASVPLRALVLCGGGNNGGDGLAIARHLHNRGAMVEVGLTTDPAKYKGDALTNWNVVRAMGLPARPFEPADLERRGVTRRGPLDPVLLIVDAIFGTGLDRPPRHPFPAIAEAINASGIPVLSVDVPSGLDCDSGLPVGPCIRATRTVTFVAEKLGFGNRDADRWLGQVTVGDIGCPLELIREVAAE